MTLIRVLSLAIAVFGSVVLSQSEADAQTAPSAPLFAILYGANETGDGDGDAWGAASVVLATTENLCFSIIVTRMGAPTAAHIHRGLPGVSGAVVVPLVAPDTGSPGTSSGCVAITAVLGQEIRNFPARFYVNVHNATFPAGAVRGQLF